MTTQRKPTFSELRKKSNFSKLKDYINKSEKKEAKDYNDTRFWKPTKTKEGTASAVIRFLPQANMEEIGWVKTHQHYFKGPTGKWLIEQCPTAIGLPCPICEANNELWNLDSDDNGPNRKIVRDRKRKVSYIANIYVISDKANPENEGKVFLYKFGAKIFNKIKNSIQPEFDDETPFDPFDILEGASFKLKVKQVDGYDNYDSSEFDKQSEFLKGKEDSIDEVLALVHDLGEFSAKENFKSYDELKKKLDSVLNGTASSQTTAEDEEVEVPKTPSKSVQSKKEKEANPVEIDSDDFEDFTSLVDDE